jgi:hypothetical protein
MDITEAIFFVLVAHFIADFPLQPEILTKYKSQSLYLMFVHCFIYAGVVFFAMNWVGFIDGDGIYIFTTLFFTHFFIDKEKCNDFKESLPIEEKKRLLHIDQILHLIVILGLVLICL